MVFTKTEFNDFKHAYRGFLGHVGGVLIATIKIDYAPKILRIKEQVLPID